MINVIAQHAGSNDRVDASSVGTGDHCIGSDLESIHLIRRINRQQILSCRCNGGCGHGVAKLDPAEPCQVRDLLIAAAANVEFSRVQTGCYSRFA